ncbi:hypothetical protein BDZ94DRAFT_1233247 [Collybia nuda]|uniref:Uncharacterized protein n=1 Tax=Collybia nuda TaxID=64659 RepID=A0A9P5YBS2_9AGAR|nr:hypothetical protein BDZ94DRAFT_1233247 [Collybia nuda]
MRLSSLIVAALAAVCVVANPLPSIQIPDAASVVGKVSKGDLSSIGKDEIISVPTTAEIKTHMHTQAEMRNTSLFYSGPGGYRDKALALGMKIGRHILTDFFLDPHYPDQWSTNNTKFWDNASRAMAQLSSGTAYVLLPSDTTGQIWFMGTVWDRVEWPTLLMNQAVDAIVRVNPDNDKHETIFLRG